MRKMFTKSAAFLVYVIFLMPMRNCEGKDSLDFAKQFLERRSKYKSLQRAQNAHNDDMCKPAPAITPSSNDNTDNKNKQKKIKKNKMTKMDARSILGFSVTAAEGRINVGVRDYVDGP